MVDAPHGCPNQEPVEQRGRLEQECRLADSGIATNENGRAGDQTAANDPVEFSEAAGNARCVRNFSIQGFQRYRLATRGAGSGAGPARDLLDERVPGAASGAFPGPLRGAGTALLADIYSR